MSTQVVTVSPELTLRQTLELLDEYHISGAPVVAGKTLVGVVSASDLLAFEVATPAVPPERGHEGEYELEAPEEWEEGNEAPGAFFSDWWSDAGADVAERFRELRSAEWDVLEEHTAAEVMNRAVCSIGPDAPVRQAADYMVRARVHRLLVLDRDQLVGILTTMDIVGAVATGRLA